MSYGDYLRLLFRQAFIDAASLTGANFKSFLVALLALPLAASGYLHFTDAVKAQDKVLWFACTWIGWLVLFGIAFLVMAFFFSSFKLFAQTEKHHRDECDAIQKKHDTVAKELSDLKAKTNHDPLGKMRADQLDAHIRSFTGLKEAFTRGDNNAVPQFHTADDECQQFVEQEFPSFGQYPKKSRGRDTFLMRHSERDFEDYRTKCESRIVCLEKLKSYIS